MPTCMDQVCKGLVLSTREPPSVGVKWGTTVVRGRQHGLPSLLGTDVILYNLQTHFSALILNLLSLSNAIKVKSNKGEENCAFPPNATAHILPRAGAVFWLQGFNSFTCSLSCCQFFHEGDEKVSELPQAHGQSRFRGSGPLPLPAVEPGTQGTGGRLRDLRSGGRGS